MSSAMAMVREPTSTPALRSPSISTWGMDPVRRQGVSQMAGAPESAIISTRGRTVSGGIPHIQFTESLKRLTK
jgi:hypothetical protein